MRCQPIDEKYFADKEETEEEKAAGWQVVKKEIVYEMFDFHDTVIIKISRSFYRMKESFKNFGHGKKNYLVWRKLLQGYYPWDTCSCFLPMFIKHLELYIDLEKKEGHSTQECIDYKISTAQETVDILRRLVEDDYSSKYIDAVEKKWGKFPYEKTTFANGSVSSKRLTPDWYISKMHKAHKKADADEERDLQRLGELMSQNMLDWWD